MMIADERQARLNGFFLGNGNDPVGFGKVGKLWPDARADAGNIPLARRPAKCNGPDRLNSNDLNVGILLVEPLGDTPERPCGPGSYKRPVNPFKLLYDLVGCLGCVNISVCRIRILVEP